MKIRDVERLPIPERRRFLKMMGLALSAPTIPPLLRYAANELAMGEAYAQAAEAALPTYFIEINLRDQWDHGHLFVAPGLATHPNLRRGTTGTQAALFFGSQELRQVGNNVYLTNESAGLAPHVDTIAMIDCCELSKGQIHGHESANALRSPGRNYNQRAGTLPMFRNDPVTNFPAGCEAFYSSTPTPATLHNYVQKSLDPTLRNGIAFKGISRSIHTAYHFAANLPGAELDRVQSKDALYQIYPERVEDLSLLPSAEHAQALVSILDKVDRRFLQSRRFETTAVASHESKLLEAQQLLYSGAQRVTRLPLSPEEIAYWSADVPAQQCDPRNVKAQIWEQTAFAYKIIASGVSRTVALEFDYVDVHDMRTESQMRIEAAQIARPLTRLIESLKTAGLYDRTLIAIYTTDGSRSPAAGSQGDRGKNTVVFAGGMIRGGYYGDIRVSSNSNDGHVYAYHAPDNTTGAPGPGFTNNEGRVSGAAVWRTAMRALSVPDELIAQFPDAAPTAPLGYLLRSNT